VLVTAELRDLNRDEKISNKSKLEFLSNTCDFYFDMDKNGIGEYVSPSAEKLLGFSQNMFVGKSCFDYMSAKARAKAKKTFDHFSVDGQPFREIYGVKAREKDEIVYNELYFTPKFNDSGRFCGYRVLGWVLKS
jgi:PAS domain S-box-containing protein